MLIGIDASRSTAEQRTGTEAYSYFLIHALLPKLLERGHRVRLYYSEPPDDETPSESAVERVIIPSRRLWTHLRLGWELRKRPPDLFFTPSHVIPIAYRGRSVATVHDLGYHHFPAAHPRGQLAYLRWSTRHNGRVSRRIVADSQATKADLIRFVGVDPVKIDVVYPGVDPKLRPEGDASALAAVQRKYQIVVPYLIYIGTLQPRKNLVRLVEAYRQSGVTQQLVLAGRAGWLSNSIMEAVTDSSDGATHPILVTGYVPEKDKAALLSGATALLFPSLYEGFGFPVLEAQACGTAVVCANTSSLPEIVGESALQVNPADTAALTSAIRRIVRDDALRQELEYKGVENVKRFAWERTAVQVLETLERAVS